MASGHAGRKRVRTAWRSFRRWRRTRPFWAGVFTLLSALLLLYPPYASLEFGAVVITLKTLGGLSALVIGTVMIICAVSFWTRPRFRLASGIVTLLLAVVAIVTVNLGSMFLGTLLGIIGAALGLAWSPAPEQPRSPRRTVGHAQAGTRTGRMPAHQAGSVRGGWE
ncbi:DUF6114 domain-containing protein [Haloactinomyces albus]|uniref:Membrane protein n=1 Tax=Haloactinomyces albus TaxID=1352928 RepID=A0AAE4CL41_9ACTN|nr:DUF6114 domain-containing protein [Haloactinomyces albus]MDR7300971.1 putative membrane protein [Haloactinomyces albus]